MADARRFSQPLHLAKPQIPTRLPSLPGPTKGWGSGLVLILLLAGCNRPAAEPPPNLLATSVAATLTAQPIIVPSSTPFIPTTAPSATPQATSTPGLAATVSATPTSSPIPLAPDDPRAGLNLSAPDILDDFSQPFWYVYSDPATANFAYENNRFSAKDNLADGFLPWSTTAREAADLYVEVTAEVGDCSGKDAYGLGIRIGGEGFNRGYTLEVSCDGAYRLRKFVAKEVPTILLNWTPSELLASGPQSTNRIGLLARGNQIYAVANGKTLSTQAIEDDSYSSGILSLFASAAQTPGLTVYFDDLAFWIISP